MNKPRIVIIRGGEWNCTSAIPRVLDTLKQLGLDASILCWDKSGKLPKREVVEGREVRRFRRYIPPRNVLLFLWWPIWWLWVIWHLIRGRYTAVHAMDIDTLIPSVIAKPFLGYKLIYDCRDGLGLILSNVRAPVPQFFTMLEHVFSPYADGIFFPFGNISLCAPFFGRRARQMLPVVRVLNVPMADAPVQYRTPTARPLRLNVSGYVSPVRGAFILAEAFKERSDVVIDIAGDILYPEIQRQFEQMSNVTLHGRVPYERAMELMDQADIISIYYDISLAVAVNASPNKMFEAMMLGKPYLTADGCWMAEIAEQFGLGWSVPYGDVDALRRLVEKLNANPSLLVEAGQRGREVFGQHFTWPRQRENLLRLYRYVLEDEPDDITPIRHEGWDRFIGLR